MIFAVLPTDDILYINPNLLGPEDDIDIDHVSLSDPWKLYLFHKMLMFLYSDDLVVQIKCHSRPANSDLISYNIGGNVANYNIFLEDLLHCSISWLIYSYTNTHPHGLASYVVSRKTVDI